jgi:hypothetical protein
MINDANWLVIRIPRMYADQVHDVSLGRIVNETLRQLDNYADIDIGEEKWEALNANLEELTRYARAIDAFSSAVREGFQLEHNAKQGEQR